MAMGPRLDIRQTQGLVMTPQLQQAIRLLQLTNLELGQYVEQELERNPILERADQDGSTELSDFEEGNLNTDPLVDNLGEAIAASDGIVDDGMVGDAAAVELDAGTLPAEGDLDGAQGPLDTDHSESYNNDGVSDRPEGQEQAAPSEGFEVGDWSGASTGLSGGESSTVTLEQVLSSEISLKDHLLEQMNVLLVDPAQRIIGHDLIDHLDEAGYLSEAADAIAERLGCDEALVEQVLSQMQRLDPPGILARNLSECLALQLQDKDRYDPAMQALVENLHLLAAMDIPQICTVCGVDREDADEMIAELKALNPKPGLAFDYDVAAPVVPDVFVTEKADGGWNVELNSDNLPRILVNRKYYAEINEAARRKEDKAYISECMQSANWLIKSLDQRARTILSVSSELVRQQDAFLANGVQDLRPLNLRAIAEVVGIHESTVSRVTSNKYMATPRGMFELKYFFTSALSSANGGDDYSSEAVRNRLRGLIDKESSAAVLSDDKLVEILRTSGIDIARRTVAKYRDAMGIPSSVQRRRAKRMEARAIG
ncbi:MAG: RNA polymerase factor sigma-54 [Rhodospirillaceae bacterium]|jgi:RNA polymerase sigma-54 factor|nr:RNA polymerase factor sigma-54 [Rhodospirillaceae bacterium]MBT4689708.1 RNA polymerase factor sigma-54 [Rhodospirillaceae bacterium]MBT5080518.1 RNA polymerase factor sigma-54 [Rhodospirillaceae bacterium]MBT5523154.1 RNA polymerase factor sigma-54 [Rhodospirillaceae bacterium]MBT5879281.1 RNA polymerase factor sigma-54 [Rhodospirillaceae bacterium]